MGDVGGSGLPRDNSQSTGQLCDGFGMAYEALEDAHDIGGDGVDQEAHARSGSG